LGGRFVLEIIGGGQVTGGPVGVWPVNTDQDLQADFKGRPVEEVRI